MVTSAKVKAQRPQSREGAEPSTAPLFCSMVPDGAGVMVMPPQHPQGCWEERPQLLYRQAAGMAGQAHGKAGEPGATRRPGRAAAPCRVRQQSGYPSTKCPIQHQLWDCFLTRAIPLPGSLLRAATPAGERSPGCSAKMGGPGEKQWALGAEREVPRDRLEEEQSPKPHAHAALSASARDGQLSPRAPRAWELALHGIPGPTSLPGEDWGVRSCLPPGKTGKSATVHGFEGIISRFPSPGMKTSSQKYPAVALPLLKLNTHGNTISASCLRISPVKGKPIPITPNLSEGC